MALVAHIDSGKTTLTESILLQSSYISAPGTVDTGSTTTDFLPVERERGITIQSASIPVTWKNWTFNLIDTPGHADFGMEVESASRVVDGAVVLIDGVEGVESQTKGVWRQLDRYGVNTRMLFVNKLDRPGASFHSSLRSLLVHCLHRNPMALVLPIASFNPQHYSAGEPGIRGMVDLVRWSVWKWDEDGTTSSAPLPRTAEDLKQCGIFPPSHPVLSHLLSARAQLLENLSMISQDFMENLLTSGEDQKGYLSIESADILPHLRDAALGNKILPVLCGSASKHIGTSLVVDYIGELFPSPLDISHPHDHKSLTQLLAWKVTWDEKKGWMTFVRVYQGKITRQTSLFNKNRNQKEKVAKLLLLYASEAKEVDELPFGSVGVILGFKHTRTGDTLTAGSNDIPSTTLRDITPPPAVISASVIPHSHSDLRPVEAALHAIARTDPSLRIDTQEGQILVHGLGQLHLEIIEQRLKDTWRVNFEFGRRYVSYRESLGLNAPMQGWDEWNGEVAGKALSVRIPLQVRPMEADETGNPIWDGNVVIDEKGRPLPAVQSMGGTLLTNVADGILNALSSSPHSSLPMTRVHIQIGSLRTLPTKVPSIITGATASILRARIRQSGPGPILEPFVNLKISIPENSLGKVVKDLTEHGGEVLDLGEGVFNRDSASDLEGYSENGIYVPPTWLSPSGSNPNIRKSTSLKRSLHAIAPLSQFLGYSNRLRALSEGHGVFEISAAGFRSVSEPRKLGILQEIGRA